MSTEDFETIADIVTRIEGEDVTAAKITARLTKLINLGVAEKTQVTIPATEGQKKRTVMGYRLIAD